MFNFEYILHFIRQFYLKSLNRQFTKAESNQKELHRDCTEQFLCQNFNCFVSYANKIRIGVNESPAESTELRQSHSLLEIADTTRCKTISTNYVCFKCVIEGENFKKQFSCSVIYSSTYCSSFSCLQQFFRHFTILLVKKIMIVTDISIRSSRIKFPIRFFLYCRLSN